MYAVIRSGGKQYRVTVGQVIELEKLPAQAGEVVNFDEVLLVAKDDQPKIGQPMVSGAKVVGEVVAHTRGIKINIIKLRRRKHHLKHQGHRQDLTAVKITEIQG